MIIMKNHSIQDLIALAERLPSGAVDPKSLDKLNAEFEELVEALEAEDEIGALTEAADAAYYAAKYLNFVAHILSITVSDVMALGYAKYSLRAAPGNPKNDDAEREAVEKVLSGATESEG